ncbi:sporulation protein [Fervidicella metallireducens AeB]|uniref:Sporulation protein n=1 Tax=Fervidicella metallireducens AeB TaxID=1403537 RepID=A0A017RYS1_9CLOT|nr:stage II sporulation protein D [Fervidicella metallireducens]EYE89832.1 sporulation protein [Fervidicella metallireducens AeB]
MRKVGYYVLLIVFLMIIIPVIVLNGVGPGIELPKIIHKITEKVPKEVEYNDKNGGPKIKLYNKAEDKIIELYLEDYLRGVVAAETPASFELEALKAQAIAARTFAVAHMNVYGGNGCARHNGADVCSEVHCQAWMSKQERMKSWDGENAEKYWKKISDAVDSTRGMVITYEGKLAKDIKYHASSGGKTENSVSVFGYESPYLVSVDSPYEKGNSRFTSVVTLKKQDFINRLKESNPSLKLSVKTLSSQVKVISYTDGGRVKDIKIGDKIFTGVDIRWAVGLKSANFTIKFDKDNIIFTVVGSGHGVGLSQWGANEMAKRGSNYSEILKHYYKGTELKEIDKVFENKK